jgi:phage FluMu gp28-like protein
MSATAPTAILLPFAQRFFAVTNRVKVWEKSRRIGASWSAASIAAVRAAAQKTSKIRGMNVFYIGYNKDMALEFIQDCGFWAKEYNLVTKVAVEQEVFKDEDKDILSYVIHFASGHRITALSSRPTNLRGKQGLVVIDEAAFHDKLDEILKAALALLMWGGEVWVISSHNGVDSQFNELCEEIRSGKKPYYLQKTTLDDALTEGLYQRICLKLGQEWTPQAETAWRNELIDFYGDGADEELFCIPRFSGGSYFPSVLLDRCMAESDAPVIKLTLKDEFAVRPEQERYDQIQGWMDRELQPLLERLDLNLKTYYGMDFGRDGDLSCLLPLQELPNLTRRAPFALEMRNVPFEQQRQILFWLVDRFPRFCGGAMDARGNGQYLAEVAMQRYGATLIHMVKASVQWYAENWPKYKAGMEDDRLQLPPSSDWKDDHRQVQVIRGVPAIPDGKNKGTDGKPRHGDGAIAGLMAWYATLNAAAPIEFRSVPERGPGLKGFAGMGREVAVAGLEFGGFQ